MEISHIKKKYYKHKAHFCIYCKEEINRIHEHFLRKHKDEVRVKEAISTKDKIERYWRWKRLTQDGDNYYNTKIDDRLGKKKVVKELEINSKKKKYYDCPVCLGRIRTTSRFHHKKLCRRIFQKKNKEETNTTANENKDLYDGASEYYINKMRQSKYLTEFILKVSQEKGKDMKKILHLMMKDLIMLETEMRKFYKTKNADLVSFFKSEKIDGFIICIKKISGEKKIDKALVFKFPFRAQRLCRLINRLSKFLINLYYKRDLNQDATDVNKFLSIFTVESDSLIKNQAYRTIQLRRIKNPQKLPKSSDINTFVTKLKADTPKLIDNLKETKSNKTWRDLAENVLCRLTVFNRRRGGAVEKLKISEYTSTEVKSKTATEEALYNLNEEEKAFLGSIKVVEILHKCNNIVPIFITCELQEAMEILLSFRKYAKINEQNEFFFAAGRNSLNSINCIKVMEKYRKFLPEEVQHLFNATNLRKHGATSAQVLDLSHQDCEEWASHMGHSLQVHKNYYRKQELVNSILKTGRILKALDSGTLKYFKGKKVNDIPLETTKDMMNAEASVSPLKPKTDEMYEKDSSNIESQDTCSSIETPKGSPQEIMMHKRTLITPNPNQHLDIPTTSASSVSITPVKKIISNRDSFHGNIHEGENLVKEQTFSARRTLFQEDSGDFETSGDENVKDARTKSKSLHDNEADSDCGEISGIPQISNPLLILKKKSLHRSSLRFPLRMKKARHPRRGNDFINN